MAGQSYGPQPTSPPRSPEPCVDQIEQPSQSSVIHIRLKSNPDLKPRQRQHHPLNANFESNHVVKRVMTTVEYEEMAQSPQYEGQQ